MQMADNTQLVPKALPTLTSRLDCLKRTCKGSILRAPHPAFSHLGGFCMVWMPRAAPGLQDHLCSAGDTISTPEQHGVPCASTLLPCSQVFLPHHRIK